MPDTDEFDQRVDPSEVLEESYNVALYMEEPFVRDADIVQRIEFVCRNLQNRSGSRLLLACMLAKIVRPEIDVRKPYTEIGGDDTFSGRRYDEQYISPFISRYKLPCNSTTAFLTPAFRNRNMALTRDSDLVGRPKELYQVILHILDDVYQEYVSPQEVLQEVVRWLIVISQENQQRISTLLATLQTPYERLPLSSEMITMLVEQHLRLPKTSRLPVLVVAAVYQSAKRYLGEQVSPLFVHNAADEQTGAVGDIEITLSDDERIVTCYEVKDRKVTEADIERAIQKISVLDYRIHNYIFVTMAPIDPLVQEYAIGLYKMNGGTEVVILDCINFLRHFLHLFHRLRTTFLDIYQDMILSEPESGVNQYVKEAFLAMRQAAEMGLNDE